MGQYHDQTFPNESSDYRAARDALLTEEIELRRQVEKVAALRRSLPLGAPHRRFTSSWRPNPSPQTGKNLTVSLYAHKCYRFQWLGGVIWEISVTMAAQFEYERHGFDGYLGNVG